MTLGRGAIAHKSYQLEELEDESSCISAVYLNENGTAKLGVTDGPVPDRVEASWVFAEVDGELTLNIERWFGADQVPFSVKRTLRGHLDAGRSADGDLPLFHGAMFQCPTDFDATGALGHFAMVAAADGEIAMNAETQGY